MPTNRYVNTGNSPIVLAHRGGAGEAPENSLAAFQHAVDLGCTYLETDVRATADGELFLWHTATSFLPNRTLAIDRLRARDIATIRVRGAPTLLKLSELLEAFPEARIAIDPKHERALELLATVIKATNAVDRVCIGASFAGRTERARRLIKQKTGRDVCTAAVDASTISRLLLRAWLPNIAMHPRASFVHPHCSLVSHRFVQAAHASGLRVIPWVVNEPATMHRLLDLGVDGMMTDYPSRLIAALRSRGQWSD